MHLDWQSETPTHSRAEYQHGQALLALEVYRGGDAWWWVVNAYLPAASPLPALSVEVDSHDDDYGGEPDEAAARERAAQVAGQVAGWIG
jgi:hypothetical protein